MVWSFQVIYDVAKRPQSWNKTGSRPPFRKQTYLAGTPPPKPTYSKNKYEASSSNGKQPIDPIKEVTIQMSSLTNQIKQLKENAKIGIGHKSLKHKCYLCGDRTHSADDCKCNTKKSSPLRFDKAADNSEASSSSSSKVKSSSLSRGSSEEPTNVWVPKKI